MYEPSEGAALETETSEEAAFTNINGTTWALNGEPIYEWQDLTTGWCLDAEVQADRLVEAPCQPTDKSDLNEYFWLRSNNEMVNVEETFLASETYSCVNADHAENGQPIDFENCNGNANQTWYYL
jgi:hypothetical protein